MDQDTRRVIGAIGAHVSWAQTDDRTARTAPARRAFDKKFEDLVDPDGTLDPADRARRAASLRKAYYLKLSLKSAEARRARRLSAALDDLAESNYGAA